MPKVGEIGGILPTRVITPLLCGIPISYDSPDSSAPMLAPIWTPNSIESNIPRPDLKLRGFDMGACGLWCADHGRPTPTSAQGVATKVGTTGAGTKRAQKNPPSRLAKGTFRLTLERQAKHYPLTYVGSEYQSGHGHGVCGYGNGD